MDVMSLRRRLMMSMGSGETLPDGWKKTTITLNSSRITTADVLATFLTDALPSCEIAFGVLDRDMSISLPQNTVTAFMWGWDTGGSAYQRNRGGQPQCQAYWTSQYDTIVETGSTFTVVYIE